MFFERFLLGKSLQQPAGLFVKSSVIHGRGVFSNRNIESGKLIEKAPLILIHEEETELLKQTVLHDYYFLVNNPEYPLAVGFGYSSMYNHSCPSNATYTIDLSKEIVIIKAFRHIHSLEEITINYNGHPEDNSPVSFTNSPGA